jgi:hypothetical protein
MIIYMKKLAALCICCASIVVVAAPARAMDLKSSKVTQVVNDVEIISADSQNKKTAVVNDIFAMPDLLRTGTASRAELVAADRTITRVGANTIFSFDPGNRTIDLQQGSLLFHSPHGKGGGTIHTGSATASVLGTTIIVTTTPNGGFKVIDLEGQVAVKFLNGLSQTLKPGQMTFILPGGKQLAPIVVFRLDTLIKKSLLVKGFFDPLPSLPLIVDQMQKQLKLIDDGRATDTGLYAGDFATPNQVEVLDPNTIQSHHTSLLIKGPLLSDATLNQPSLSGPSIPDPPDHLFLTAPFQLAGNTYFTGQSFLGFGALNILLNPPASGTGPLTVDFSPYSSLSTFDLVAVNNLDFATSVTFAGFNSPGIQTLSLVAGNQFLFSPGITITANVNDFEWVTPTTLTMTGVALQNSLGEIGLKSGSDISLGNSTTITAKNLIKLNAQNNVTLSGSTLSADPAAGAVNISTTAGNVNIANSTIQSEFLTINSGNGILLSSDGTVLPQSKPQPAGNLKNWALSLATANLQAAGAISVSQMDFSRFTVINMAANTINLSDVNLGTGIVTLKSLLGLLNVGSSKNGYVNFIQNVTYDGGAAQNYVNNGGGITVTTIH